MDSTVLCRSEDGHCTDYGVTVELCWLHAPTSRGGEGATEKAVLDSSSGLGRPGSPAMPILGYRLQQTI